MDTDFFIEKIIMMKRKIIQSYQKIILPLVFALLMGSCEKDLNLDVNLPRQFTPTTVNTTNGEVQAIVSWPASLFSAGKGVTYTVEVSQDPTFQGTIDKTVQTDSTAVVFTDTDLQVKVDYYARVMANAVNGSGASSWVYSDDPFMITGEQIFFPVLDAELKDKSVTLRWRATAGLTKIVLTETGGTPVDITLDATDLTNLYKLITNLTPQTEYTAEIFKGTVTKGTVTFTTKVPSIFTTELSPGDNLLDAVNNAADGDVIGLNPGTYDCVDGGGTFSNMVILKKTITLQSVSGDPTDTKVNYKEVTLKGTGAGLIFKGLEFDGAPSSTAGQPALYFINFTGENSDSEPAVFTDILVDNCIVHDMGNTFMRANRASNAGDHKINSIKVNNSLIYNSAKINTNYSLFQINRLQFVSIEIINSTLYSIGRAFIDWDTNFSFSPKPTILVDQCTINNFGLANMSYIFVDVNSLDVDVAIQNTIFMNAPYPGETVQSFIRASTATMRITNCNYFNLTDGGAPATDLTIPGNVALTNNKNIDLGWSATTTDFSLPPGSELRTSGTTGGPIGDLRWAF